jgi:hypothetical protein
MKVYDVKIEGISPLLMHRYPMGPDDTGHGPGTSAAIPNNDREAEAERAAYRLASGELYQPAEHIEAAMIGGGKFHKIGRKGAAGLVPAGIFVKQRQLGHGTQEYIIDSRRVVIRSTGGAIVRHRPRLDKWALSFTLEVDESIFRKDLVLRILEDAGRKVGIGDFRPQRRGSFGRFVVTQFEEANGDA